MQARFIMKKLTSPIKKKKSVQFVDFQVFDTVFLHLHIYKSVVLKLIAHYRPFF